MYVLGRGVTLDDAEAATLYRRAAEQGDPSAQDNLVVGDGSGRAISQDDAEDVRCGPPGTKRRVKPTPSASSVSCTTSILTFLRTTRKPSGGTA